ncbi:hypothetical protein Forpe1208_v013206 [Fusarium oxysporum f. sp. rapae]|uniref:Uncharacterized protein n=1 Tax=Fusarium oxysporum f. sp. rapae TaxID=485398 RepID=A0A8J5NL57_FUSOX|nr:hypothetical protein Forpe1208_v013206 [Fusarium oxysporum f. sp. rapae]
MNIEVQRTRVQFSRSYSCSPIIRVTGSWFLVPCSIETRSLKTVRLPYFNCIFFPSPNNACPTSRKAKTKTQLIFTFVSISE